eukprot:TRINITY_DN6028_c0_g1_i1.p1 TRINITY_DN6028_c0_g1~~TRINITY_DN6028_c0_g1_i1.p1  ORF type:complete len:506 (+),score=57.67 TRINITY_DN6028_c0_g1_i1:53-1519(+)
MAARAFALTVLVFGIIGCTSASNVASNTTALEICSQVYPFCQWNDTAIWEHGKVPGPNDRVSMDLRTTNTIIRIVSDSPVQIKAFIVLAEHIFCRIDIYSSFEVVEDIEAFRLHIGLQGQIKSPKMTLWKTEIYMSMGGRFEVDGPVSVKGGLVQLGQTRSGYFKIGQLSIEEATVVLATNGEIKQYTQTGGSLSVTEHAMVEVHKWSFTNSYLHSTHGSVITSLESLDMHHSIIDVHSQFVLPAPNVTLTLFNTTGTFDHRLEQPSSPKINITAGNIKLGGISYTVAVANVTVSHAAVLSLVTAVANYSTFVAYLPANIDLFDYSELKISTTYDVKLHGSLTFHDRGARFSLEFPWQSDGTTDATALSVSRDLTLNETKLVVSYARVYQDAITVVDFYGQRRGKFDDVIGLKNARVPVDFFVTEFRYSQMKVAFYFHGQNWPGIGWGVLPVALVVAVVFVALTVFAARQIAFFKGENDVSIFGYSRV